MTHAEEIREIGGVRVQLLVGGDGPPLLYLHGAGGGGLWLPFHERLARHFTVYAPAHPGFGKSEDPAWLESVQDLAFYYLEMLDELKLEAVHLVGLSLGGWIAAHMAVMCSHRLGRLVAAGIRVPGVTLPDLFAMGPEESVSILYKHPAAAAVLYPPDPTMEQIEAQLRQRMTLARLAWNPYFEDPTLLRRLHRIRVPTLIVWGEEDRLFPLAHAEAFRSAIPGSSLVVHPGSGHVPPLDAPEAFVATVARFLSGREA
jgi:pimeloyl-ACP methyl ester carboxylesterase